MLSAVVPPTDIIYNKHLSQDHNYILFHLQRFDHYFDDSIENPGD